MLLSSKRYLQSGFLLSNEKYNFSFVRFGRPIHSTMVLSDLVMRCDLKYTMYADSNLIAFSMVSIPSFIVSNSSALIRNSKRVLLQYSMFERTFYRMFSFLFFSYMYTFIRSRSFFFWPSVKHFTTNRSIGLMYSSSSVDSTGFFEDYFFGVVDADSKVNINLYLQLSSIFSDVSFCRIFSSILCIPFTYKNGF